MKFVLSDGTVVNSYGFRVRTSGIKFKRFEANPVMLAEHQNSIASVLGKWTNLTVEGVVVTAEAEFDEEDQDAIKVKGKVTRGYIKGASIGIRFDPSKMELMPDGIWELTECELFEVSLCAIPSNSAAVRLFAADSGQLLSESDVQLSLSALLNNDLSKIPEMKKIELSVAALAALGLNEQPREDQIELLNSKIVELKRELGAEQTARKALEDQAEAEKTKKAADLVAAALAAGKVKAHPAHVQHVSVFP